MHLGEFAREVEYLDPGAPSAGYPVIKEKDIPSEVAEPARDLVTVKS